MYTRVNLPAIILLIMPLLGFSTVSAEVGPYPPKLFPDGKLGVIGDSLALGVHTSQMCGKTDAFKCAKNYLGTSSADWSYVAADKSWSLASLLGFDSQHVIGAFGGGEEWKDGLEQAVSIMAEPQVEAVFIGLGANNVCQPRNYRYGNDLAQIAGHIDDTLTYLTDRLPAGGRIYWSAVLDVRQLHTVMARRDHNYWFESCQATWDLDAGKIKDDAADDLCDHFFSNTVCQFSSAVEEAKDELMKLLFNRWLDTQGVEAGPCGKILDSRSTGRDREAARQFNIALNELMALKAQEYDGRKGVRVYYSDRVFDASVNLRPYHVSRLDCFHPNRSGQIFMAAETWRGFSPGFNQARTIYFDELDNQDYCMQEFTQWQSCWMEVGENNGSGAGDLVINQHELRLRDNNMGIMRALDLAGTEAAWVSFNWRRKKLDNDSDYVSFDVSPDGGQTWHRIDRYRGDANDYNMHRGLYYDITPYATGDTLIRFLGSKKLGAHDKVFFDNIKVLGWSPPGITQSVVE